MKPNFREMMKTDEGCTRLLVQVKYKKGKFKCKCCGSKAYVPLINKKATIECAQCGDRISLTKGTFFERLRTPLPKVFGILYEYAECEGKSAAALSREFEVSYSTVWRLLHKLRRLFEEIYQPLIRGVTVHYSRLKQVMFKRSVESAPKSDAKPMMTLAARTIFEESAVGKAIGKISRKVQGIARKYGQPYAAELCFFAASFNFLGFFRFCFNARPVGNKEIEAYSSPDFLVLPA